MVSAPVKLGHMMRQPLPLSLNVSGFALISYLVQPSVKVEVEQSVFPLSQLLGKTLQPPLLSFNAVGCSRFIQLLPVLISQHVRLLQRLGDRVPHCLFHWVGLEGTRRALLPSRRERRVGTAAPVDTMLFAGHPRIRCSAPGTPYQTPQ